MQWLACSCMHFVGNCVLVFLNVLKHFLISGLPPLSGLLSQRLRLKNKRTWVWKWKCVVFIGHEAWEIPNTWEMFIRKNLESRRFSESGGSWLTWLKKRKEGASSSSAALALFFLSLLSLPGLGAAGEVAGREGRRGPRGFEVLMA